MNFNDFASVGIDGRILEAADALGYKTPTPVQEETIPLCVSKCDLLVQAPTGTGKTAAFGVPVLNDIDIESKAIQALILSPTRELAMQITAELKKLAANLTGLSVAAVYGGQNIERQLALIRKKPHIIVGTTGRVMDHIRRGTLKLHEVNTVVLDEADEMLSMGFRDDIDFILKKMQKNIQKLFFSATMPDEISELSKKYQNSPMFVKTTCEGMDLPVITQYALSVKEENKYNLMRRIIADNDYKNVLVFCNTKVKVAELNDALNKDFYLSMALHGDLKQRERDKVMKSFRAHGINILVATDVCARGIDVDGIEAIINYDIPLDEEYYVHRIGRTARANRSGVAYSFVTSRDRLRLTACEKAAGAKMLPIEVEGLTEKNNLKEGGKYGLPTTRFFLNVGTKDNADAEGLLGFITGNTLIKQDDVYEIKLKEVYSFVEVDGKFAEEMLSLNNARCFKRKLSVEISNGKGSRDNKDGNVRKQAANARYNNSEGKRYGDGKQDGVKKDGGKQDGGKRGNAYSRNNGKRLDSSTGLADTKNDKENKRNAEQGKYRKSNRGNAPSKDGVGKKYYADRKNNSGDSFDKDTKFNSASGDTALASKPREFVKRDDKPYGKSRRESSVDKTKANKPAITEKNTKTVKDTAFKKKVRSEGGAAAVKGADMGYSKPKRKASSDTGKKKYGEINNAAVKGKSTEFVADRHGVKEVKRTKKMFYYTDK